MDAEAPYCSKNMLGNCSQIGGVDTEAPYFQNTQQKHARKFEDGLTLPRWVNFAEMGLHCQDGLTLLRWVDFAKMC